MLLCVERVERNTRERKREGVYCVKLFVLINCKLLFV